jgi:NDP-sugar pyrophosphorylase family protein
LIGGGGWSYPKSILTIGDRCTVHDVFINIAMPIKIGNDVGISQKTSFFTHYFWNSVFDGYPQKFEGIKINDGCIIGAHAIFLPGTSIGKNSAIGAGSVITKKFPSNCVIGGNPAKIIKSSIKKKLTSKKKLQLLKNSLQWYIEILQTKGFSVKSQKGIYHIIQKDKKKVILCYDKVSKESKFRRIVLTFESIKPSKNETIINLNKKSITGKEDEITDDLRDFLRKIGVRIFTKRKFNSIKYKMSFQLE